MKTFNAVIKGIVPGLLMHRFSDGSLEPNPQAHIVDRGTKEQQAASVAYLLDDGSLYQPAEHILQCLVKAGSNFQIKGKGKKTYKDAIKGSITIEPECIQHFEDDGVTPRKDYKIDSRPVRIKGARIMRHRPWLPEWKLEFTILVLEVKLIPGEVLNAVLVSAGQTIGIGDYRPRFGRFIVESFKETKES